jgi:type IV secretory pathway TrbD component
MENRGRTNLIADAMILRPMGLVAIGLGSVVWAVGVAPFVAMTRPTDLDDSMDYLIMRPVRYTFVDPLGHHH